jgi:3D-(3,5/4)-trihydroxycyclohexane-1,2-dione acylhydrolase (decyclizing)
VRYSEAENTFKSFAEKFNIPFAETQAGKSAVEWTHPLNLGGLGTTGELAANIIAQKADLVIGVGTRYTDFTTSSKYLFSDPDVEFLNINVASFDAYKMDGVRVTADAGAALAAIGDRLGRAGYRTAYKDEIKNAKKAWLDELHRLDGIEYGPGFVPEIAGHLDDKLPEYSEALGSGLTQTRVLGIINSVIDGGAIAVGASGSLPGDMQRVWRPSQPDTYHMEYGYSCMGYEIGAALGVKLARPEREVYAFVGDGAYMMLHSELITSVAEGRKINVIVFDNMGYGCINNLEMQQGMGSYGTEFRSRSAETGKFDGGLLKVDFAKSAEAFGCRGYTVRSEAELRAALEDAKKQTVSTLIDIKVLPKTMTHGYEAWWRCGVAQVSEKKSVRAASEDMQAHIDAARKY